MLGAVFGRDPTSGEEAKRQYQSYRQQIEMPHGQQPPTSRPDGRPITPRIGLLLIGPEK
jgi:hypothetical protein